MVSRVEDRASNMLVQYRQHQQQEMMQLVKKSKALRFKRYSSSSSSSFNGAKDDGISSAIFFLACIACSPFHTSPQPPA
uniref:Uncharacterized protein n=1 Tax=Kalanchoe fedtschenkoi TaxID=63787 RepID=A0A7N0RIJ6_KALFE